MSKWPLMVAMSSGRRAVGGAHLVDVGAAFDERLAPVAHRALARGEMQRRQAALLADQLVVGERRVTPAIVRGRGAAAAAPGRRAAAPAAADCALFAFCASRISCCSLSSRRDHAAQIDDLRRDAPASAPRCSSSAHDLRRDRRRRRTSAPSGRWPIPSRSRRRRARAAPAPPSALPDARRQHQRRRAGRGRARSTLAPAATQRIDHGARAGLAGEVQRRVAAEARRRARRWRRRRAASRRASASPCIAAQCSAVMPSPCAALTSAPCFSSCAPRRRPGHRRVGDRRRACARRAPAPRSSSVPPRCQAASRARIVSTVSFLEHAHTSTALATL